MQFVEDLKEAQLVFEEAADQYAFRHALTREAVYVSLLVRDRKRYHNAIAETIERVYADELDSHIADLAYHFYEAGAWGRALEYSRRAGEKAQALYAPREAIGHFQRALEAARNISTSISPQLYRARGQAYETVGDFESARADYEQALSAAQGVHDGAAEWRSLIDLGFLWGGRDYQRTGELFHRALELANTLGDAKLRAHSLNRFGNWLLNIGQAEESLQAHREALAIFQAQEDRRGTAETLDLLGLTAALYGDLVDSDRQYRQVVELFRELDDKRGLIESLTAIATNAGSSETVFTKTRPPEEYKRRAAEALSVARQIDWVAGQALAQWSLSLTLSAFGEFGEALLHANEALRLASEIEHRQWVVAAHFALGDAYASLLRPDLAIQHLAPALPLARDLGSAFWTGNVASELAIAYLLKKELPLAEAVLEMLIPADSKPRNLAERRVLWVRGELALAHGAADAALRTVQLLIESAPGEDRTQPIPALLKLKGEALMALKRFDDAQRALEEAKRGAMERGIRPLLWQIHASLGNLHRRLKRKEEAEHEFAAARGIIQTLAATIDEAGLREAFTRAALERLPREKPVPARRKAKKDSVG